MSSVFPPHIYSPCEARPYPNLFLTGAQIMDPASGQAFRGSVRIRGGVITEIGPDLKPEAPEDITDCHGRILAPGMIDMRVHAVDVDAALKGGVTSLALQPAQATVIDSDATVERIRRRSVEDGRVKVFPMGAITKGLLGEEMAEIGQMQAAGACAFTDCFKTVETAQTLRRVLEYARYFDALIVDFAEEPSLSEGGHAREGEIATRLGLNPIPAAAEAIQIERNCHLSALTGARLHIALVSTAAGVDAIRKAKTAGIRVTASTAPHYLYLNETALEGYRTFAKVSPPLGGEEDRLALIRGVADGTIDTLVSDHAPRSTDTKRLPFAQADSGIVGLETLLPLTLSSVKAGGFDLMTALKALTFTPARHLGLPSGRLQPGAPADIMIFDPDKPWIIDRHQLASRANNMIQDRMLAQGKVWMTITDGRIHYSETNLKAPTKDQGA